MLANSLLAFSAPLNGRACPTDLSAAVVEVPEGCVVDVPRDMVLMDRDVAASLTVQVETIDRRIALEVRTATRSQAADHLLAMQELQIDLWQCRERTKLTQESVSRCNQWHRQPEVVAPLTVALCIGTMIGASHLIDRTTP